MGAMMDAANGLIDELGQQCERRSRQLLDQRVARSGTDRQPRRRQSTINGLSGGGQTHIVDGVETAQDELQTARTLGAVPTRSWS